MTRRKDTANPPDATAAGPHSRSAPAEDPNSVGARTATTTAWPTRFRCPNGEPLRLPLRPRLASWDRSDHPSQLELDRFLTATANLVLPRIAGLADPLALRLDVGLPQPTQLLDAHDLDNYLYPLTTRLARLSGREFATVWGTKRRG